MANNLRRLWRNIADRILLLGFTGLAAATPLSGQGPGPELVPLEPGVVKVDGVLDEWPAKRPNARIHTRDKIWKVDTRRAWGGEADFSADIWYAYDATHFYLAGLIRDDHHVPVAEGADLETGDSIEVFFDVDVDEKEDVGHRLGKEDVQLFLLPRSGKWFRRPWDRDTPGMRPNPTDADWTGIQLAYKPRDKTSYTFEARIPFHNFLAMDKTKVVDRIGFHLAVNDRDPGSETVHYATINGKNPTLDARNFEILRFSTPLMASEEQGSALDAQLSAALPWGLVGLLVLTTMLFFSRRRAPLVRLTRMHGWLASGLGIVFLTAGLLLPAWFSSSESPAKRDLDGAVKVLEESLPLMVQGTLTSYVGASRDKPLLDLLKGRPIRRKQSLSYQFLSEMATEKAPKRFGTPPGEYPEEGFHVRPYWLPLPIEQPQAFTWKAPLDAGNLYFVVSPVDFGFFQSPPPTLRVTYRLREGPEVSRRLSLGVARVACEVFGKPNRDMTYVSDAIPAGVVGVTITALGGVEIDLIGLTLVPVDPDAEPQTLVLGQALGEIETDLRGIYPKGAGIQLQNHATFRVEIPRGRVRAFDHMWLVYSATYPVLAATEPPKGEEVCRVKIRFAKGEQVVVLRHQESMFYGLNSRNSGDVAKGVPAVQAEVRGGEDKRINVVYRVDLQENMPVHGLEFVSAGQYPVRFRSVIFGYERSVAPPEPTGSPLRAAEEPGQVRLRDDVFGLIRGANFGIYRNGSLITSDLREGDRGRHAELPAAVQEALLRSPKKTYRGFVDDGDARIYRRFLRLSDEAGVVLGVFGVDPGFGERQRWVSLIGMLLCLMSVPFILLLFNDALGYLRNIRVRLMVVVSVAAVAPMAVLFILLVRTLEGDHLIEQKRAVREAARAAANQLQDRQAKLLESVRSQVDYLRKVEREVRSEVDPDLAKLRARLQSAMSSQRDWASGFMKLEYTPESGAPKWLQPFTTFDAESDIRLDTPLRDEPSVYVDGFPSKEGLIGVRIQNGPMSLSVARPIDSRLLGEVSPGWAATLCAIDGYALTASKGHEEWLQLGQQAELLKARRGVRAAAQESREPVFQRHRVAGVGWIAAYEVLRDQQDTARAILGVVQRDEAAKLTIASHRIPVRTFFVVISGLLLMLSVALASIVTSRITDPIERLEHGAEALRRGEFDIRVDSREGGQIGRLTETFNNMAQDLRGRIQDLNHLNRGIQELTSGLDLDQVLASAVAFFSRHSPADRVRVILLDWERDRAELFGEDRRELDRGAPDVATVLAASGPLCMRLTEDLEGGVLAGLFPGYHSVLVLPLTIAGRSRGGILLLFESAHPVKVNLELLSTIAAQTTAAVENARLYHHAVEDFYTGTYVPDYFSRLVGRAVANAQEGGQCLSLIGIRLLRGEQLEQALGAEGYGRYMERIASVVRRQLPVSARIGRASGDAFQVLLADVDREGAAAIAQGLSQALIEADLEVRGPGDLAVARVTFPEEGASAEFLFHALESVQNAGTADPVAGVFDSGEETGVVYSSSAMGDVVRVLRRVAPSELTILLDGETGTGKEVLANLIHKWSKRAKGPLVKVHCAALSESLLQSELFGHEKGAFTGATERRIGKFEQAEGGTIFLDEIGEVSLDTQVKLLRVLQEREVDRVGGTAPVSVDVRVIAATNRDIDTMVANGTFREDLYYRLQGMVVTVPPLRERKSEIPALFEVFRREAVAAGHTAVRGFTTDAMDEIFRRDWPGNIRELRNAAFRAMVLAGDGLVDRSHMLGILPQTMGGGLAELDAVPTVAEQREPLGLDTPSAPTPDPGPPDLGEDGVDPSLPTVVVPRPPENGAPRLSSRLAILYRLVEERGSVSNRDYVDLAGVSPRTGLRDLNELLARGLIERTGRRRGARYQLRTTGSGATKSDSASGE